MQSGHSRQRAEALSAARFAGTRTTLSAGPRNLPRPGWLANNGRFHTTKAVQQWLAEHRDQIEIYWLPPYSPSLNLIARLWGHLKRTVLANVLYHTLDDLVAAFRKGVTRITGNRDHMGFMFDHADLTQEMQNQVRNRAA